MRKKFDKLKILLFVFIIVFNIVCQFTVVKAETEAEKEAKENIETYYNLYKDNPNDLETWLHNGRRSLYGSSSKQYL